MSQTRLFPPGFVPPCQPTSVRVLPAGADWLHEVKHDGFRLMVRRDGGRVRLFTRNGHDWAERYPAITAAAAALHARSFLIDGEAVIADARGVAGPCGPFRQQKFKPFSAGWPRLRLAFRDRN